eukprot:TRINITY_DN2504_c2_g2_i5.p1 TRINITY_DN2504_c2_g2~~TRINITY_DN2504_c2_g2_i5.p1  ORF type:complete len:312 (+),score=39.66 TRINITY_DN2504_c2_g2_i5:81-938(+)
MCFRHCKALLEMLEIYSEYPQKIESQFRKWSINYHPDKPPNGDEAYFKLVSHASEVCIDYLRRYHEAYPQETPHHDRPVPPPYSNSSSTPFTSDQRHSPGAGAYTSPPHEQQQQQHKYQHQHQHQHQHQQQQRQDKRQQQPDQNHKREEETKEPPLHPALLLLYHHPRYASYMGRINSLSPQEYDLLRSVIPDLASTIQSSIDNLISTSISSAINEIITNIDSNKRSNCDHQTKLWNAIQQATKSLASLPEQIRNNALAGMHYEYQAYENWIARWDHIRAMFAQQ